MVSSQSDWEKLSIQSALYAGSTMLVSLVFVLLLSKSGGAVGRVLSALSHDKVVGIALIGIYAALGSFVAFGFNKTLPSKYQIDTMFAVPATSHDICKALHEANEMDYNTCYMIATEREYRYRQSDDYTNGAMDANPDNLNML